MLKRLLWFGMCFFCLGLLVPTMLPHATADDLLPTNNTSLKATALQTCHAEPRWSYLINVRRGPGSNWGVMRQLLHQAETREMLVIGRDTSDEWYQVVLPEPYETEVGWVWLDGINLFGNCADLPLTDAEPEITIEQVPATPAPIPMPAFADHLRLTAFDRAWALNGGMVYVRRDLPELNNRGRVQAHILLTDLTAPQLRVTPTIGATPDVSGAFVSDMAREAGAFAAINGDFYGGNYMPQGITVIEGEVITAPKNRAAFALTEDHDPFIGYFTEGWTWFGVVTASNGEVIPLQLQNLPCNPLWLCIYSHHINGQLSGRYGGVRVLLDPTFRVLDIVNNTTITIPDGHYVLNAGDETGDWLLENITVGDQLDILRETTPDWQRFESAISGGPRILVDGEFWQDCDPREEVFFCEGFDEAFRNTHYYETSMPRTAIGYSADGRLLVSIVVEGYEVQDSRGMTQRELAATFIEFGAWQAMEFDGGGSSSMWIAPGGRVSDVGNRGERRISNALIFYWDE